MPYAQPAAVERNIYERVCDVRYGTVQPGTPLQAPRTAMESHRAPSLQSVDSVGNGSVRSGSMTDYPRQWEPEQRVRSRENVTGPPPYAHPPSHPHNTRMLNGVHYRQDSSDSGSYHRGEPGNHGNQTTYHSPDSGDSGFLSHPSSELDSRGGGSGQTHIYSEIGRWVGGVGGWVGSGGLGCILSAEGLTVKYVQCALCVRGCVVHECFVWECWGFMWFVWVHPMDVFCVSHMPVT